MSGHPSFLRLASGVISGIAALSGCNTPSPPSPSSTTLVVSVTDRGVPVAARVLLLDRHDRPVHLGPFDLYRYLGATRPNPVCAIAPGVIASWDGLILARGDARIPVGVETCPASPAIAYGRYRVLAWRGIEYERWEGTVDLTAGRGDTSLSIELDRAWTADGTLAADLHTHAGASTDSMLANEHRVMAQAAAGIQMVALTDHDTTGDLDAEIAGLQLGERLGSIAGNELTADTVHLSAYPAAGSPPALPTATPDQLIATARAMSTNPIVQLDHPRSASSGLFERTRWDGVVWPPPFPITFDALEVISGATMFDQDGGRAAAHSVRDYFSFVDHGRLLIAVGASDTHDLDGQLDGVGRTYVFVDDARRASLDESAFLVGLRARRTVATAGPWLEVKVKAGEGETAHAGPGQSITAAANAVWLDVTVARARWVSVQHLHVTIGSPSGPRVVHTIAVPPQVRSHHWAGRVEVGTADTWIAVSAEGEPAMPVPLTGTFRTHSAGGGVPLAVTSPILVDVDRDGRWKRGIADLSLGP